MSAVTEHEDQQIARANESGGPSVVFMHGLWLLPSSWDRWAPRFEEAGYTAVSPGWPDDPETVQEAKAHPEVFAGKSVGQIADHFCDVMLDLAADARAGKAERFTAAPTRSPRRRLDETRAARSPRLKWEPEEALPAAAE